MSDYLKEILSKKNLINILILAILVLAIPLTIKLLRQQQILFSKAATDTVQLVDNLCTSTQNNKKVLICSTLALKFVAPSEVDIISAQGIVKKTYAQESVTTQCKGNKSWEQIDAELRTAGWDGTYQHDQDELDAYNRTSCAVDDCKDNPVTPPDGYKWHAICSAFCSSKDNSDCKQYENTTDGYVRAETSYWCYGFNSAPRCMQLQYIGSRSTPTPAPVVSTSTPTPTPVPAPAGFVCTKDDYGPLSNKSQWCACAAQNSDTGSLIRENCPQAPVSSTASLTVSPNPVVKNASGKWPDLTLNVSADSSTSWGVYYQNGPTCTLSSCSLQGWTPIGDISSGNNTVNWSSTNLQNVSAGMHTFAVLNNPPTKVLTVTDVSFTESSSTSSPTPTPTATPIPAPVITKVRYAQTRSDLTNPNLRKEIAYRSGGVKEDITLTDTSVGTKFIFAQFIDDKGQITDANPFPFQIDLVGPSPTITGFSCEVDITKTDNSSDLLFKFAGANFGSSKGSITLEDGTSISNIDSWTNIFVSARLNNPPLSQTAIGTQYTATLTTKDGQKSLPQQCRVGLTQISLGAKLFCRKEMNFDADNIDLTLILDKDKTQKSREKVTIDKSGNITNIKTKLKSGEAYIACIKAPLSLRKCSGAFIALAGNNILTIDLPVGDYNGDGAINNFDKSMLQSQWGPMNASKNCDVNRDGFCNTFEWSCMLHDFNASNQKEP